MKKNQKIWLWIFLAMFIIPEILWSPIGNFYYELLQTSQSGGTQPFRNNFLQSSDNLQYLKFVIFLQFVGLLSLILMIKNKKEISKFLRYLLIIILSILLIIVGFSSYFVLTFKVGIF